MPERRWLHMKVDIDKLLEGEPKPTVSMEKLHTTEPKVIRCPRCGSDDTMKYGVRAGTQNYICRKCNRKFNAKGAPLTMRTPKEVVSAGLSMFYDGLSLSAIARQVEQSFNHPVNPTSVYRWVMRYTQEAVDTLGGAKITTPSNIWVVDETVIKVGGKNLWFWDVIDEETRFLLGSHLSRSRTIPDAMTVMMDAVQRVNRPPKVILSDGLPAYRDGIERVFGADARHIVSKGFTSEVNTNLIERFHGTLKQRTKVIRGFKTKETADLIMRGFLVHYNFFRPHMTLKGKTPAQVAGIEAQCKGWADIVNRSCVVFMQPVSLPQHLRKLT